MNGTKDLVVGASMLMAMVMVAVFALGRPAHAGARAPAPAQSVASDGLPDLDRLPPTAAGPATSQLVTSAPPASGERAQLDLLMASGKPQDALLAYRLLVACGAVRSNDHSGFQGHIAQGADAGCDAVDQALIERRVDLLRIAVDGHAAGAVAELVAQGPQGQPIAAVWNDPRYAGWKQQSVDAVTQAADAGDVAALQALCHLYGRGDLPDDNGAAAIKYSVAWADVVTAGNASPTQVQTRDREWVAHYGAFLAPEQAAAAVAAGHSLAAGVHST